MLCSIFSGIIGENTKHNGGHLVESEHSRMGNMGSILCVSLLACLIRRCGQATNLACANLSSASVHAKLHND